MSGRTLVLLRHGRTAYNAAGRIQGQIDSSLDDLGHAQAAAVAPVLAERRPVVLWASDLGRAATTASYVAEACGLEVRHDRRLREYDLGEREGITRTELAEIAPDEVEHLRQGRYDLLPGAEKTADVRARMGEVLRELWSTLGPDDLAVAVSHGAAIRTAVGELLGWSDEVTHTLAGLDNCGWVELVDDADRVALRLRAYNRTAGTVATDEARVEQPEVDAAP